MRGYRGWEGGRGGGRGIGCKIAQTSPATCHGVVVVVVAVVVVVVPRLVSAAVCLKWSSAVTYSPGSLLEYGLMLGV